MKHFKFLAWAIIFASILLSASIYFGFVYLGDSIANKGIPTTFTVYN